MNNEELEEQTYTGKLDNHGCGICLGDTIKLTKVDNVGYLNKEDVYVIKYSKEVCGAFTVGDNQRYLLRYNTQCVITK